MQLVYVLCDCRLRLCIICGGATARALWYDIAAIMS